MTMHILARDQVAEQYPYTISDLRRDHPATSFPARPSAAMLADWGVYPVRATERPEHDPIAQTVTEGAPEHVGGEWVQTWVVSSATAGEKAERVQRHMADVTRAVDEHVEARARALEYNGAAHLAGYVTSTVAEWAAEAQAFVAWRDLVWQAAIAAQDSAEASGEIPSVADVIASLPEWPQDQEPA